LAGLAGESAADRTLAVGCANQLAVLAGLAGESAADRTLAVGCANQLAVLAGLTGESFARPSRQAAGQNP